MCAVFSFSSMLSLSDVCELHMQNHSRSQPYRGKSYGRIELSTSRDQKVRSEELYEAYLLCSKVCIINGDVIKTSIKCRNRLET